MTKTKTKTKVKLGEYARFKVKVCADAMTYPITVDVKNKFTGDRVTLSLSIVEARQMRDATAQAVYDAATAARIARCEVAE